MAAISSDIDPQALFSSFSGARGLLLAVSGGPDSLALMHLAAQWRGRRRTPIAVAVVDHGLRPQAAREAGQVADWARELGFDAHVLVWRGDKPKSRIQERARQARYDLLAACARDVGADHILTAHHADDQAETILFRLSRGSSIAGLAGMAEKTALQGLVLARPLLGLPKRSLVDFCRDRGLDFFEDPSNLDPSFARAKIRRLAAQLAALGLTRKSLLILGARAAKNDAAIEFAADVLQQRLGGGEGYDLTLLAQTPQAVFERLLARLIAALGQPAPLRLERLESCAARLRACAREGRKAKLTLAGAILQLDAAGVLRIYREPARRRGVTPLGGPVKKPSADDRRA